MRVLLIDVNCKFSSTGKIVYDLFAQLNKNGHIAAIAYGRGPVINEPNIFKFSSDVEVYFHALLTRITGLTGCFSPIATQKLIRFIDQFSPDVVHLNDMHGYYVNILPLMDYLVKNKIKTVWTFHCEFMYTGKCGHAIECEKWKTECGKCPNLRDYPSSLFFDFTKKMFCDKKKIFTTYRSLTIISPSKWLADRIKMSFLFDKKIKVIHNGIDTKSIFYPRSYTHLKIKHHIDDEKIVLAVAPNLMSQAKGGRHVVALAKYMENERIKFILIGVTDLTEKFNPNIIILGKMADQNQLAQYYSMADLFVICSLKENFPTTCIEAISCGTPVCGFDEGGTRETAPGALGMFVPYGDIAGLSNAVTSILSQKKSVERISRYGEKMYSKEFMYSQYSKIYFSE